MTDLDTLIEHAQRASVDRVKAERYVRELDHWARPVPEPAPRRWVPWLVAGAALAAAVVVLLRGPGEPGAPVVAPRLPVAIGDRVAIITAPNTAYRVVRADRDSSEIAVERGTVTARLWRGSQPHRLVLAGGGVTATATGTVYSLTVGAAAPVVSIAEGTVDVRGADGSHIVSAGASWPPGAPAADPAAVAVLLALPQPVIAGVTVDAGTAPAAPEPADAATGAASEVDGGATRIVRTDATDVSKHTVQRPVPMAIKDRWRSARLLRAQGKFADALAECLAIADADDPIWSPIALIEAMWIDLGPLASPERVIALADRMIRRWPEHTLVPNARELRCRALAQLGRGAECTSAPPP